MRQGHAAAKAVADAETMMAKFEGLDGIKEQVREMLCRAIDAQQYENAPIAISDSASTANYNCIFIGNSGVGKTNFVKAVLYPALKGLGVLKGKLYEVTADDLKGAGLATVMKKAKGGMLFFDEAYAATGCKALTANLTRALPKDGPQCRVMMVVAGYKEQMSAWMGTNQGLRARLGGYVFEIPDYSAEEIVRIGERFVCEEHRFRLAGARAREALKAAAEHVAKIAPGSGRANADAIRYVLDKALGHFSKRRQRSNCGGSMAQALTVADIEAGLAQLKADAAATSATGSSSSADPANDGHLAERAEALKAIWSRVGEESASRRRTRPLDRLDVFRKIAKRNEHVWALWANEKDRKNALKKRGGNLGPDVPFIRAWVAAFKAAFGDDFEFTPPDRGSKDAWVRPWNTDQLVEVR